MTGAQLNESRVCADTEECHSALPARYGQWSKLCRVLAVAPPTPALHDTAATGLKAVAADNVCGPDSSGGACTSEGPDLNPNSTPTPTPTLALAPALTPTLTLTLTLALALAPNPNPNPNPNQV